MLLLRTTGRVHTVVIHVCTNYISIVILYYISMTVNSIL
jgi:hypothetical protein